MKPTFVAKLPERPSSARSLDDLTRLGLLPIATPELHAVAEQFSVAITPAMLEIINPTDPHDPIAAQFMPKADELKILPAETDDPISDYPFSPVKGIVHRYPDRVLLKPLLACPVHCRFCFRRDQLDEPGNVLRGDALDQAINYIAQHPEIWEVILTGGDPFMLPDKHIANIMKRLNAIPHVKIIRFHTRIPVVDPARVTPALIAALKGRAPVYVLLHCNHPRELTDAARAACAMIVDAGMPMLSQSVLLRGVNDDPLVLAELMRSFVEIRVKPHYIHHADKARGTGHFGVPIKEGQSLMRGLRGHFSGLAQPTYMLDIPGGHGKAPIGPVYMTECDSGSIVEDYRGGKHSYINEDDTGSA